MPANYDMIISQSPPVFSHSPPTGFLSDYMSTYRRPFEPPGFSRSHHHPHLHSNHHSHHHHNHHHNHHSTGHHLGGGGGLGSNVHRNYLHMKSINALNIKMACAPKSCLAKHHHHNDDDGGVDQVDNCKRLPRSASDGGMRALPPSKVKRVVFADDKGLELTQVKVMSEPSNVPPYWTLQFLAEVTHGLISPVSITEEWVVDFKQPASDYLEFRRILEEKNVSLENVIVKENESIVVGTVKVRNLSFNKEVVVRVTYDNWKSQQDIFCTYSNLGGPPVAGSFALYDTFSFKLTLPPASKRSVEFCVCFRCNGQEYWDSNQGQNYTLSKRVNGSGGGGGVEHDSILTNSYDAAKMNQVTTIIQDIKSSWNSGMVAESQRPYW